MSTEIAIERIRELHSPLWTYDDCDCCPPREYMEYCKQCQVDYPCETIQVLNEI